MIIGFAKGGLGNQLFQLNAIVSARRGNETLVLLGFDAIPRQMALGRTIRIHAMRRSVRKWLRRLFIGFENWLEEKARLGLVGVVRYGEDLGGFSRSVGRLERVTMSRDYFQSIGPGDVNAGLISAILEVRRYLSTRQDWREAEWLFNSKRPICFVHVRRGDFLNWPVGASTALPFGWYYRQMERVRDVHPNVLFVILGDDEDYNVNNFSTLNYCYVHKSLGVWDDFFMMAKCRLGILSSSTYSWWAARISSYESSGWFIGPDGWTNWHGFYGDALSPPFTENLDLAPVVK